MEKLKVTWKKTQTTNLYCEACFTELQWNTVQTKSECTHNWRNYDSQRECINNATIYTAYFILDYSGYGLV